MNSLLNFFAFAPVAFSNSGLNNDDKFINESIYEYHWYFIIFDTFVTLYLVGLLVLFYMNLNEDLPDFSENIKKIFKAYTGILSYLILKICMIEGMKKIESISHSTNSETFV